MNRKGLLNADETATKLNVGKRTLLRWARENKIESVKISPKKILFTTEAVEKFVQQRTHGILYKSKSPHRACAKKTRLKNERGGLKRSSRKSWRSLRKEVTTWQ